MLPFTPEQFVEVFAAYNRETAPAPLLGYVLGLLALPALWRRDRHAERIAASSIALMWISTGALYHWTYFAEINPIARVFGALFIVQGAALLWFGVFSARLTFRWPSARRGAAGAALILYSMIGYPLAAAAIGHTYPAMPTFGITPCPVTLFTAGMLLLASHPPRLLWVVPLCWSVVAGSAAFLLRMPQDWPLLATALVAGSGIIGFRRRRLQRHPKAA